jgi:hypothetical protein
VAIGFARLPAALATGIVAGILTVLPLVPAVLLVTVARSRGAGVLFGLAGFVAMALVATVVWVAVPASVVERVGPGGALSRSASLTSGSRLRIFGVLVSFGVLSWLVTKGIGLVVDPRTFEQARTQVWLLLASQFLVFGPLGSIASAVGYHDLRVRKEGADVEDLARVFE